MIVTPLLIRINAMMSEPIHLTPEQIRANRERDNEAATLKEKEKELRLLNALSAEKIRQQAEAAGKWIYDPNFKKWYTPEEFHDEFRLYFKDNPLFYRVKLRHPNDGITAGFRQLADLQDRLTAFTKKVVEYYSE
jgi:hypothetical protein